MLQICDYQPDRSFRTLPHGEDVFHHALRHVTEGERHFHVSDGEGEPLYDLCYTENQEWAQSDPQYVNSSIFRDYPLYPPYLFYDEGDTERLCMDLPDMFGTVWFEGVSEYSVVLAKLLLSCTDKTVWFRDERIRWFIPDSERLVIGRPSPAKAEGGVLDVFSNFVPSAFNGDFSKVDAVCLFHHVFFFQWLTPLPLSRVRYVEFRIPKTEGIGSILLAYGRGKAFFGARGMQVTIRKNSTRYPDAMIQKYFRIPFTPEDSDESNTIYIVNYYAVMYAKMLRRKGDLNLSVLQPGFLKDLQTYGDAVIGNRRFLGVLLRGSDYITANMGGTSRAVSVDSTAGTIREWMNSGDYDKIFLATEDGDILDRMRELFPGEVIAVSQERYRVSDFSEGMTTISELDRARHPADTRQAFMEDTTVNYIYAIYLLSRCRSFLYSCHCGGAMLARQMSEDRFEKMCCLSDLK